MAQGNTDPPLGYMGEWVEVSGEEEAFKDSRLYQLIVDTIYPIGTVYWSTVNTDPSTLFGGTWVRLPSVGYLEGFQWKRTG